MFIIALRNNLSSTYARILRVDLVRSVHLYLNQLTIRKVAARVVALTFTSRSIGKTTPKLSASVNISFTKPDHCLEIRPTWADPSLDETYITPTELLEKLYRQLTEQIWESSKK